MNNDKQRILVVDDVAENIQILLSRLKDDYIILVATNGKKAIELSRNEPQPDILLLDIMMPEMDGYEVCKRLKADKLTKDIPIIFVTALSEIENEKKGLNLGAVDYITKPINPDLVKARVVNHLELKRHRDNLQETLKTKEEIMITQSRNASMGEMISLIAHQWRQPISIISMIMNNMIMDVELENVDKRELVEDANSVIEQVEYLSQTIDDFRNFLRQDKKKNEVRLEDVMADAKKIIIKSLEKYNIHMSVENNIDYKVNIFSRELLHVYINLIKNAKDALIDNKDEDRRIDIVFSDDGENAITTICDNGGGIKDDILDNIFEHHFSTKDEKDGSGLGLYMSKIIVEKHLNGALSVENNKDGVCFKISIPKADEISIKDVDI